MKEDIRKLILSLGADVCGIGDIGRFSDVPAGFSPADILPECRSVVSFGVALPKGLTAAGPKIIYAYYNDYSAKLADAVAFAGAKAIEEKYRCTAVPMPSDGPYDAWDAENLRGHGLISVKHAAVSCGIGTLGKNTLLINRKYGNLLTLGAILTDLDLPSDPPAGDVCINGCRKCLESCPVHAINGGTVDQKLCRNHTYGKNARGFDTVSCNVCRTVCPMRFGEK